jgi:16S rRNA (guanine527-N7)-methyltransferase
MIMKHIAVSLGALLVVGPAAGERWVDVGTGAGLPGLVLKMWDESQDISLVDGSRKKCIFLQTARQELGLPPIPILCARVETLVARGEEIGRFDVLFARAVADLPTTLREFGPLLRAGGRLVTFKGLRWAEEMASATQSGALGKFGRHLETVHVPWTPAHVLLLQKRS